MASKISKIRIIFARKDKDSVLRELMLWGCVELRDQDEDYEHPDYSGFIKRDTIDISHYESDLAKLTQAFAIMSQYTPEKTSKSILRLDISGEDLFRGVGSESSLELADKVIELENEILELDLKITVENELIERMSPWKTLDLPLDTKGTAESSVILGTISVYSDWNVIKSKISDSVEDVEFFSVSTAKKVNHLCIICLRSKVEEVEELLRNHEFSIEDFGDLQGSASEITDNATKRIDDIKKQKSDLANKIVEAADKYSNLLICYDYIGTQIARAQVIERLYASDSSFMLSGWIPSTTAGEFTVALSKYTCAWELIDMTEAELEVGPSKLKRGFFARIAESLLRFFGKVPKTNSKILNPLTVSTKYAVITDYLADNDDG
jgi:V/A-type H+-transporting ATPase subunit I